MFFRLHGEVTPRSALGDDDVIQLFRLFTEHFDHPSLELFRQDLEAKDWVLLLRDDEGTPQGFSTLALYSTAVEGKAISVVYSGDTIVRPAYWGTLELSKLWIRTVLSLSKGMRRPLYWLLISSGFRTYRFLPVFFREFYPRHDRPTPPNILQMMNSLAIRHFGREYDPAAGIVRFGAGAAPLRDGIGEVTFRRLEDPHVAFFVERNPGHSVGDELLCLTEISTENLTPAGLRMAGV